MATRAKRGRRGYHRVKNLDTLIAAVQARQILWDRSFNGHRDWSKVDRYWDEVAEEVGLSSGICRKQWKNLKDQCRKELKKDGFRSRWTHFLKLSFLHSQFLEDDTDDEMDKDDSNVRNITIKQELGGQEFKKKRLIQKNWRKLQVDVNKLIELVKGNELLWNRNAKGHHNRYKLDEAWKQIAQDLGCTRDDARLKWKYLRDQVRVEMRKESSDWEYLPRVQFLADQFALAEDGPDENDSISQDYSDNDNAAEYIVNYMPDEAQMAEIQNPLCVNKQEFDEFDTKAEEQSEFYGAHSIDMPELVNKGFDLNAIPKDEDLAFLISLVPHMRKLDPANKLMLRMKMQELVYNTVYNKQ